jgi:hypothetical protein
MSELWVGLGWCLGFLGFFGGIALIIWAGKEV